MPHYYVEGLFANKQGVKKKLKKGAYPANSIEPYAKSIWANSPKEAIQVATAELAGGEWTEGPKVNQVTEEQRMRSMGAPELPGLSTRPFEKPKKAR
jgi:hypothetical protein